MPGPYRSAEIETMAARRPGLYDPGYEHDSCGFGLIAQVDDQASARVVSMAFDALERLGHRGAVGADGISSDGCGLLFYRPETWLRALAGESGISLAGRFAAGLVFLSPESEVATRAIDELERRLRDESLVVAGWREVPVDASVCGPQAAQAMPRIAQIFVNAAADTDENAFERALFRAR
ncbi:MAG TPA: glutamate synthase large subunit, partial [Rhodanobacteraceae bacterium]